MRARVRTLLPSPTVGAAGLAALAMAIGVTPSARAAQSPGSVLVVVNAASEVSKQVGEHYVARRHIPPERLLALRVSTDETISRSDYVDQIEAPIAKWIAGRGLQDRILYIVLAKGIPLRVNGSTGRGGTTASVDSELTLLYRKTVGTAVPVRGSLANPYFLGNRPIGDARAFSRQAHDIYLVTRLDGYSLDDVLGLVDRAQRPSQEGKILLDMKADVPRLAGDLWLREAATVLGQTGAGDRVLLEQTTNAAPNTLDVLGYYSWGSNDPALASRDPGIRFVPGAIAATYVSTDARTIAEPPAAWTTGNWQDQKTWYAGSPQSLAGDLARAGVTGMAAHVSEPFLDAAVRPQVLFPAYLAGRNLAEAFYLALPTLSWQALVVGDPLCAPFRLAEAPATNADAPADPETGLPALFAARRAAVLQGPGIDAAAVRLLLKGEALLAADDRAGARLALEQAVGRSGRLTVAQLLLATLYEGDEDHARATARYRAVVENEPLNVFALNNLAYLLAEHAKAPAEGLPFAERAHRLSPTDPNILDTLGWVRHLLGDKDGGPRLLTEAARLAPGKADIQLHAAIACAAAGRLAEAKRYLARTIEIAPALADSEQVSTVQRLLR